MTQPHAYGQLREHDDWTMRITALPAGERGRWYDDIKVMLLAKGMLQRDRRSAVAHETVHAERGDVGCAGHSPHVSMRQERYADSESARRLITPAALVAALLWTDDEQELAEELNVSVEMVQVRLRDMSESERGAIWAELDEREAGLPWA